MKSIDEFGIPLQPQSPPSKKPSSQPVGDLGIDSSDLWPESKAPPVEDDLIRDFLDGKAEADEAHDVENFIMHYQSWQDAYHKLKKNRQSVK